MAENCLGSNRKLCRLAVEFSSALRFRPLNLPFWRQCGCVDRACCKSSDGFPMGYSSVVLRAFLAYFSKKN